MKWSHFPGANVRWDCHRRDTWKIFLNYSETLDNITQKYGSFVVGKKSQGSDDRIREQGPWQTTQTSVSFNPL